MSFGKELGWDLANYHYYQPYAILHGRMYLDFWPTSFVYQYINPTIDFFSYFLIVYFPPAAVEFILGAIHGINFWLLFVIATLFVNPPIALCTAFLGMYGPSAFSGIGSFQNDNLVSIFVLASILLYLKGQTKLTIDPMARIETNFILAGILLGVGTGLKLPAGVFFFGVFLSTLFLPITFANRTRLLFFSGLSFAVGLLLSSGYWMYWMWIQHHNPFFPFLFNSTMNWQDTRFLPQGTWQTLFYPFYFSWDGRTSDGGFRDFRFSMIYVLLIIVCAFRFIFRQSTDKNVAITWLLTFFIFSYIAWQAYFSIARYLTALEMLAPLLIFLLIKQIPVRPYLHASIIILLFYSLFFFMSPIPASRVRWYDTTFFNVKLPHTVTQTNEALVLVAYSVYTHGKPWLDANPRPQAYLIPSFPPRWRFIGVPFAHEKYLADIKTTQKTRDLIQTYSNPIYLLTADINMPELYKTAFSFGLTPAGSCEKILSDRQKMTGQEVLLCPVRR